MAGDQLLPNPSDHAIAIHHCVPIAWFLLPTFFSIKMTPTSRRCQTCYMASIIPEHFVPFPCSVQFLLHIHIFNNVLRMLGCRITHQAFGKRFIIQSMLFFSPQEQFEFALTAVAEEVNAILKALPQWAARPPKGSCRIHPSFSSSSVPVNVLGNRDLTLTVYLLL